MEFVIGILLILTFFALAYYCVRGYNLMIGFLVISVLWTILSLAGAGISSPSFRGSLINLIQDCHQSLASVPAKLKHRIIRNELRGRNPRTCKGQDCP